jgi:hypothetical protein
MMKTAVRMIKATLELEIISVKQKKAAVGLMKRQNAALKMQNAAVELKKEVIKLIKQP